MEEIIVYIVVMEEKKSIKKIVYKVDMREITKYLSRNGGEKIDKIVYKVDMEEKKCYKVDMIEKTIYKVDIEEEILYKLDG